MAAKVVSMSDRYIASMVLHATGDAMGYKNGKWEFNFSTEDIHQQAQELGGIDALVIEPKNWRVSDDTVLQLANAEFLIDHSKNEKPGSNLYCKLVDYYKKGMHDMQGRAPGNTTINNVGKLSIREPNGYKRPFNPTGGGCGASMRSPCIGLRYAKLEEKQELIEFALESSRMSHHHPIGYLGGVAAALMTSYAIQNVPIEKWGSTCLNDIKLAKKYLQDIKDEHLTDNLNAWSTFTQPFEEYLKVKGLDVGEAKAGYSGDLKSRDQFYKSIANNKWPGSNGLDSLLIAYDGILECKGDWKELCNRAMLHGGDNDSTGCIAGAFYGALYGFKGVSPNNYEKIEYSDRLIRCGRELHKIEFGDEK